MKRSASIARVVAIAIGLTVGLWRFWDGLIALATLTSLDGTLGMILICVCALSLLPLTIVGFFAPREAGLALIAAVVGGTVGYAMLVGPRHMLVGVNGLLIFFYRFPIPYLAVGFLPLFSARRAHDAVPDLAGSTNR